jgi:hypothetical protein
MFALENVKGYIYFILLEYVEEEEEEEEEDY